MTVRDANTALTRRHFLLAGSAAGALASLPPIVRAGGSAGRVIVIGGGFGGATCARYLRRLDPALSITLVERDPQFITCPFSNLVVAGRADLAAITHSYAGLRAAGVEVIHANVKSIDAEAHRIALEDGSKLPYDRLVVSPGVSLRYDATPGYDEAAAHLMPHAWKAGTQTLLLRDQLQAMADGGVVVIAPPANPFRCPPGPYERASLIAGYLKRHKPRSKILILDAKDKFSKQGLFQDGWDTLYPGMIEWVAGSTGGLVERVDAATRTLVTESGFTEHTAAVVNFITRQHAGAIAHRADLVDDSGWCPVAAHNFASTRVPDVHVIGDAANAGAMPKSGFAANSQAKVCAAAIVSELSGRTPVEPSFVNTCYSLVAEDYGISVAAVYRAMDGKIAAIKGAGGVSPKTDDAAFRASEAAYARGWYASMASDIWG